MNQIELIILLIMLAGGDTHAAVIAMEEEASRN